jgi:flagellar biosynthesis/type III secretory pathway protein FliH
MSSVIKAEAAKSVRSFDLRAIAGRAVESMDAPAPRSQAELALDEAREKIARLGAQLVAIDKERSDERDAAYAAGLKEGAERAADGADRRLARVREAGDVALDIWRARLSELDILAAMLAQGAIAKVFSPHADLADLVARAIGAKVAQLRAESVVAIRVSNEDFEEPSAIVAAARGAEIICDPLLKSGECRIDLRLGEVDLTIDGLAGELDGFFRSLGEPV